MKKKIFFMFLLCIVFSLTSLEAHATGFKKFKPADVAMIGGYGYTDQGLIFSNVQFPSSVARGINDASPIELSKLKKGVSSASNALGIVEVGDAGIDAAARNGGITKIKYVDYKTGKIYIPLLFFPIYINEIQTIVYGE